MKDHRREKKKMETEKSSFDRILFAIIYHLYLVCLPIIIWQYIVSDKSHRIEYTSVENGG